MWEPINCCGCCTRKEGSLAIGILYLIGALIGIFVGIWAVSFVMTETIQEQICRAPGYAMQCRDITRNVVIGVGFVYFLILLMVLMFASMLIHGVRTNDQCLMLPLMILMLINLILVTVGALINVITAFVVAGFLAGFFSILIFTLQIFLQTFFLLVLRAHRNDLLRGSAAVHERLTEEMEVQADKIEFTPKY